MEHLLLKVLQFDVATPTANCFCERFLAQLNADETTASLAMVSSARKFGKPHLAPFCVANSFCIVLFNGCMVLCSILWNCL